MHDWAGQDPSGSIWVVRHIILIEPSARTTGAGLVSPHFGHLGWFDPNPASSCDHGPLNEFEYNTLVGPCNDPPPIHRCRSWGG